MAEKGNSSWFVVGERRYANVTLIVRGSRTAAGEAAATISRNEIAGHFYRGAEAGSCDRARDIGASRTARARARRTRKRAAGQDPSSALSWRPREDSNLRTRLRRPMLYPLSYEGGGWRIPGGSPRRPWRTGGSTHDLLLGLDDGADPLLVARVGAADVLLRDPVDDRPGGVTFQPF